MVTLNEWLQRHPNQENKEILWIGSQNLEGDLTISSVSFPHLKRLYCENNKLKNLRLENLQHLEEIYACIQIC